MRVTARRQPLRVRIPERSIGVGRVFWPEQHHGCRPHELRHAVDVPVGIAVVGHAGRKPEEGLDTQEVAEVFLDLRPRQVGVPVGVQQALLGGEQCPLAVDEERAALQDHRRLVAAYAKCSGQQLRHSGVLVVGQVLLAPRVAAEVDHRNVAALVGNEDRSVVAHPRVVDRQLERFDAGAAAVPVAGMLYLIERLGDLSRSAR